jgi:hypothetical protein
MDPSKFFNRKINIRDPKKPYEKGKFIDESQNYSNRISSRINQSPLTKSLFSFRNKVFRLENLLTDILNLDKKKNVQRQRIKANEVPDKKPKTKGPQIFGNIIQRPKTGALGLIRDFVTFTFLGWLFTRIQPLLGGLTKLAPLLEGMAWFIGGTIKNMVDIFATFLKLGFDAKEKFDNIVGDIEKNTKGIDKVFDATLNPLKAVFTGVIQLANSFLDVSVGQDELNEAKTQVAKEKTADTITPMPPLPKVDAPQTPHTPDSFPRTPTRPGMVQAAHTGGVIRGYNKGGRIDPRTPITRGIESRRREIPKPKPIIQPQKTAPGKDVGGDKKVKQLYDQTTGGIPDFIPLPSFFRSDKKSGFTALMGASEEYKKPMTNDILGIGNMMGASVDSALGQKIEKKSYTQFADGIKYLVNYGMTEPEEFAKIDLEEMVRKIVEPRVNMAINRIQEEINKKSTVEPEPGGGMGGEGGDIGTIDMDGFSPEDVDALGRMIHAESGSESALGKAGVLAVILNRYRLIKSGTPPSQFNISGKTSEQVTIRDILFAGGTGPGNQFSPYKDGSFERTSSAAGKSALAAAIQSGGNDPQKFKDNLISSGLSEADAEYVMRSVSFSNARTRSSRPFNTREVAVGNHVFQQSPNVRLSGQLGAIDATVQTFSVGDVPSVSTAERGKFASGLRIGPPGDLDGQQTGLDMNLPGGIGTPIYAPFDLIYKSRGTDGKPSVGLDGTPGILGSRGRGFGFYGSYFYKIGNKEYEVLMGHFHSMPLRGTREGEVIPKGTLLGYQGASGRSLGGPGPNGAYPHITLHVNGVGFRASNSELVRVARLISRTKSSNRANLNTSRPTPQTSQQPPPQRQQAPRSPEVERIAQTPPGEPYLIQGKMYYVDLKNNKIFTVNEKGERVEIKVGPGQNEWLLKEIYKMRQLRQNQRISSNNQTESLLADQAIRRKYGGLVYKNGNSPTLPSQKYSSYGGDQSPQIAIQPIIISNQVPVPVSSGAVPFAVPVISSSDTRLT